jgi:hypothetical protein
MLLLLVEKTLGLTQNGTLINHRISRRVSWEKARTPKMQIGSICTMVQAT